MVAAKKKLVNTIGWSANELGNIASKKPELAKVAGAISKNGGTKKLVYK
jgi:hypothetical protein